MKNQNVIKILRRSSPSHVNSVYSIPSYFFQIRVKYVLSYFPSLRINISYACQTFPASSPPMMQGRRSLSVNCTLAKQNWGWWNNGESINGQQCKITSVVWSQKTNNGPSPTWSLFGNPITCSQCTAYRYMFVSLYLEPVQCIDPHILFTIHQN